MKVLAKTTVLFLSKCSPSKENTWSDDFKAQNSKSTTNGGLEREKLQDIKLIKQRLNHSIRLGSKNK